MANFIVKLYKAGKHSINGLRHAIASEWALRFELLILLIALPCAFWIARSAVEFILLASSLLILVVTELLNTAVEITINRIGLEFHELSGLAKDVASSAIFVASINVILTWGILLASRFYFVNGGTA